MISVDVWDKLLDAAPALTLLFGTLAFCGIAWLARTRRKPQRYPAQHGLGADAYTSPFAREIAERQLADRRDDDPLPLPMQNPWSR